MKDKSSPGTRRSVFLAPTSTGTSLGLWPRISCSEGPRLPCDIAVAGHVAVPTLLSHHQDACPKENSLGCGLEQLKRAVLTVQLWTHALNCASFSGKKSLPAHLSVWSHHLHLPTPPNLSECPSVTNLKGLRQQKLVLSQIRRQEI